MLPFSWTHSSWVKTRGLLTEEEGEPLPGGQPALPRAVLPADQPHPAPCTCCPALLPRGLHPEAPASLRPCGLPPSPLLSVSPPCLNVMTSLTTLQGGDGC